MARKAFKHGLRIGHYWIGAVVGVQLLIWLATGIYFNLTPHEQLKGMQYNVGQPKSVLAVNAELLLPLSSLLTNYPEIEQASLIALADKPLYLLDKQIQRYEYHCQQQILIDAYSGQVISIDQTLAQTLALQTYRGPGQVVQVSLLNAPFDAWPKQCNPLWQISLDDELNTRIYINGINGLLVGHKNDGTDLADWMFKLHFMDYLHQGSFNNPFSWLFSLLMLLSALSGLYWVADNLRLKRYRIK